jgi:hypothetical protein
MEPALYYVRSRYPLALGWSEIGIGYGAASTLTLKCEEPTGDHVCIQPYTRHDWKNCADVVACVNYGSRPVKFVGLPDEYAARSNWDRPSTFAEMCDAVLTAGLFVGVLSSWTNFAAIFRKRQIIVSFTTDVPIVNPNATIMVNPTLEKLQEIVSGIQWS